MSSSSKIHVTGLPSAVSEGDIRSVFGKYGDVKIVFVPEERNPSASCFVVFSNHEEAQNALRNLNYTEFAAGGDRRTIKITFGDEETLKQIKDGQNRLLVEGFADSVPESAVYEAFSRVGEVLYCATPLDSEQKPVGVCLVSCRTKGDADKMIAQLNNTVVSGKTIKVSYAADKLHA